MIGQLIDWMIPFLAFLLFLAVEGVVIFHFLRWIGVIV